MTGSGHDPHGRYCAAMDPTPWWLPHLIASLAFLAAAASAAFAFFTWRTSVEAAKASSESAKAAQDTARISQAAALVCQVDLDLQPTANDGFVHAEYGTRRARLTNRGDEVAFNVSINREATEVRVEEFLGRTLNRGESIEFTLHPPDTMVEMPDGTQMNLTSMYREMVLLHKLYFTFQRPEGLGGETVTVGFAYEEVFGPLSG